MTLIDHENCPGTQRPGRARRALVAALAILAWSMTGCAFAVEHPAVTAGSIAGVLGFGTCKLASDNYGACVAVAGGAGAFLALVAATAIWLGGDGHTVMTEPQAQPLPEEYQPRRQRKKPADPDGSVPASPSPAPATSPASLAPPASPAPPTTPVPSGATSVPSGATPVPSGAT